MSAGNCFELTLELGRTTLGSSCVALAWDGRVEFARNFFPIPEALRGDIPWPS